MSRLEVYVEQYLDYKDHPRPPVCPEAEWRMLFFLYAMRQSRVKLPIEQVSFVHVRSGEFITSPCIRKSQVFGVRNYLTLPRYENDDHLYLGASGHTLQGAHPITIDPIGRYILRPIIQSPNMQIFDRLKSCLHVEESAYHWLRYSVENDGYVPTLLHCIADSVYGY